jgi:hypothetical protein
MSDHAYSLVAGIVFLLVAIAHLLRMALGTPVVVQGVSIPMWASAIALVIAGFLSYEGFRFAGRPGPKG